MYECLTGNSIKCIPLPDYGREVIWNFFLLNISQIYLSLTETIS